MKIGFNIDTNVVDSNTGKLKFVIRLSEELRKREVKIDNKNPDIFLGLPKYKFSSKAKINVLRLDGITLNTHKKIYNSRIKSLLKLIKKSDAIIYQSNFCKEAHNKFLGVNDDKPFKIIFNGANPDEFLPRKPKNYFLAVAKWRECKRLKTIVESFLIALNMGLDSDLFIAGDPDYIVDHTRIKYLKWQNREQIKKLLSEAIASLHLTWLDWCPNSMVESLVAGCPVIYTKSGGHIELVGNSGIGVEGVAWDFKAFNNNVPPDIDIKEVALVMIEIKNKNMKIRERKDLHISSICDQYLSFFKELLER